MDIVYKKVGDLIPYEHNARKNDEAVGMVAQSIKTFGFKVPIVVDKNNVIVAGHTRLRAAKLLDIDEVPVIVADDLNDEQIRAFRLADNKVAEFSSWDFEELDNELSQIFDISMEDFGFNLDDVADDKFADEVKHLENKQATIDRSTSILNTDIAIFDGDGPWDIPKMYPVKHLPNVDEWISFNYCNSDDDPLNHGVHFFLHDYQFERVWNRPLDYIELLSQYPVVCSPDFSPMGGLPMATQLWNHYRKMWCARLWQENGITVVPTVTWSTDAGSLEWFLDGIPRESVIITSTMWTHTNEQLEEFKKGWDIIVDKLNPSLVLTYGDPLECMSNVETRAVARFQDKWE